MGLFLAIYCMCVSVYMRPVFHWLLAHQRCSLLLKQHIPLSPCSPLAVISLSMCWCSVNKASVPCIPIPLLFPPTPNSQFSPTLTSRGCVSPHDSAYSSPSIVGLPHASFLLSVIAWRQVRDQCVVQTTSWSQCSRSCGMGVSSRVTNDNTRCKLIKETRLCNIRPCSSMSIPVKVRKVFGTFKILSQKLFCQTDAPQPCHLGFMLNGFRIELLSWGSLVLMSYNVCFSFSCMLLWCFFSSP